MESDLILSRDEDTDAWRRDFFGEFLTPQERLAYDTEFGAGLDHLRLITHRVAPSSTQTVHRPFARETRAFASEINRVSAQEEIVSCERIIRGFFDYPELVDSLQASLDELNAVSDLPPVSIEMIRDLSVDLRVVYWLSGQSGDSWESDLAELENLHVLMQNFGLVRKQIQIMCEAVKRSPLSKNEWLEQFDPTDVVRNIAQSVCSYLQLLEIQLTEMPDLSEC